MKIRRKLKRMLQQVRTDNLYKFQSPNYKRLYVVNKKPVNVYKWFLYDVSDNIVCTYVAFCVYIEKGEYKIHFHFIHKTINKKILAEHIYYKMATNNDFKFFVKLLYKAPLLNYDEI